VARPFEITLARPFEITLARLFRVHDETIQKTNEVTT